MRIYFILCFLSVLIGREAWSDKTLDTMYKEIKCPVCQGQSIYDSGHPVAYELRAFVAHMHAEGLSSQKIYERLRSQYGDEVLFDPPYISATWALWWAPVLFLSVALISFLRRRFSNKQSFSHDYLSY